MTKLLNTFSAHVRKASYYAWLAVSAVGYFAASRFVQDWMYRRLPSNRDQLDIFPAFPVIPEPYEIPFYLVGYAAIPLAAFGLSVFWEQYGGKLWRYRYAIGIGVIGVVLVGIAWKFQSVSPARYLTYLATHDPLHVLWLIVTKRAYVLRLAVTASVVFFFTLVWFWRHPTADRFRRWVGAPARRWVVPAVVGLLAFLIFTPNFPYEAGHYNYVIGTLNDILHGKAFLYETSSQYGILSMYLTAGVFKYLLPLSYAHLSFLLQVFYVLFYVALFVALTRWFKSERFALVGTASALAIHFFLQIDPFRSAVSYPGPTTFRNGFFIVVLLALLAFVERPTPWRRELALMLAGLAPFWNVDTGLYVAAATAAVFGYRELADSARPWSVRLRNAAGVVLRIAGYGLAVFLAISLINVAIFGAWPRWQLITDALSFYNGGFGKIPMPAVGAFLIYVLVYASSFVWLANRAIRREPVSLPWFFITMYGIFSFFYYVGNSAWGYIPPVSVPFVLVILCFAHEFIVAARTPSPPSLVRFWYAFLFFVVFLLLAKIPMEFVGRDYTGISQNLNGVRAEDADLYRDAQDLKRSFPNVDRLAVFHWHDTKLLIFAGKVNVFDIYDNFNVVFKSRFEDVVAQALANRPEYLIIGTKRDERIEAFAERMRGHYEPVASLRTLDIYRRTRP